MPTEMTNRDGTTDSMISPTHSRAYPIWPSNSCCAGINGRLAAIFPEVIARHGVFNHKMRELRICIVLCCEDVVENEPGSQAEQAATGEIGAAGPMNSEAGGSGVVGGGGGRQ